MKKLTLLTNSKLNLKSVLLIGAASIVTSTGASAQQLNSELFQDFSQSDDVGSSAQDDVVTSGSGSQRVRTEFTLSLIHI